MELPKYVFKQGLMLKIIYKFKCLKKIIRINMNINAKNLTMLHEKSNI